MSTSTRKHASALLTTVALALVLLVGAPQPTQAQTGGCPSVGTDFGSTGPFAVTVETGPQHTYYTPQNLGSLGCERHPVILWGNGTFTSPSWYDGLLRHLASHGFIVAAANTSNAGSGQEMLAGLDNLTTFDADPNSRFHQRVETGRVLTTGHSQGGAGTVRAAMDPRVTAMAPIEGATTPTGVTGAALYLAGENDPLTSSMLTAYAASDHIPAAFAELAGAGHLEPLGDGGGFRPALTAWARWMLMDDPAAAARFAGPDCGLCTSPNWSDYRTNARFADLDPGDPGGPGEPGDPDTCVTAVNSQHVQAGRATQSFVLVRAVGSNDLLGLSSSTTSVRETAPGHWERVGSC